jgi:hypothetical protein
MSPIRERTKKAIAQHRAWRQPDLRRSYAGISVSAVAHRSSATIPTPTTTTSYRSPTQNHSSTSIRSNNTFPNIALSHSGSSSVPFDAAAAVYEDIEASESRLIHDFNSANLVQDHLQQIENLILSPSMKSNVSSTSDRSINNSNLNDEMVDVSYPGEAHTHRLGIEANEVYDTNPSNEVELLRRQKYVYESYRTLQYQSPAMSSSSTDVPTASNQQPIIFRDDESAGTGMSQQELIRKKARTNRRKRLSTKTKKPILQLPTQLLLPPRISTPHRHPYCAIQKQSPDALSAPSKHPRTTDKLKSINYQQYDDPEELESSSTTAETANESGDTPPGGTIQALVPQRWSPDVTLAEKSAQQPRRRRQKYPTLAVRGDDALLWMDPIDQRSIGEESYSVTGTVRRDFNDDEKRSTEKLTKVNIQENLNSEPRSSNTDETISKAVMQLPRTSVRFARSEGGREDDESSMPWDQKTDMKCTTMISPSSVLDKIREEVQTDELPMNEINKPTVPKSILRKSRYKASRMGDLNISYNRPNHFVENERSEMEPMKHERELSPPRIPMPMSDLEGLDLSPIPCGLEAENQSMMEDSVDLNAAPTTYIGHPAEKHLQKTMATFLAMRDGELADHVRDQEIYPDPPLEIDVRMGQGQCEAFLNLDIY